MVTDYIKARDVLESRLRAVFSDSAYSDLYPITGKVPQVFLGFPTTEPPFYVAVDEIVDASTTSGSASMGHDEVTFSLNVWLCAQHRELKVAANTLLTYIDAVFGCVMVDPQLNFTVDNALPSIETAGTAADSSKRYIAAACVSISCRVSSACPAALAQLVKADNERLRKEAADGSDGG